MMATPHPQRARTEPPKSRLQGILARVEDDLRDQAGTVRMPEFVLMAMFAGAGTFTPVVPVLLPISYTAAILLCTVAVFRRPERALGELSGLGLLFGGVLFYVASVSALSPVVETDEWSRRIVRLVVVVVVLFFFVSRRLDLVSGLKGLGAGMVLNAGLFYAGLAPDRYGGVLTGFFGDKNQAGLYHAVVGILLLALCHRRWTQLAVIALSAGALWLTGSRTSMAAFAFGILWILLSPRLGNFFRVLVAGLVVWTVQFLEETVARAGVFADRVGSDLLRERIERAAELKLADTPFQGQGLGQAFAWVEGEDWFFHSAYSTLFVEGGYLYLVIIVGVTVLFGLRPFRRSVPTRTTLAAEGGTLALLICAWQLGEVFLTLPWALVMAMALHPWATSDMHQAGAEQLEPHPRSAT